MANFNEFCLWKKEKIQEYLRDRGLPTTGNKEELVVLAFGVSYFSIPQKASVRGNQAESKLTEQVDVLPNPLSGLNSGWGKGRACK